MTHGTGYAYRRGCRCGLCVQAIHRQWNQAAARQRGGETWRDAGHVREHIQVLQRRGVSLSQIIRATGLSGDTVRRIAGGISRNCTARVAEAILAVTTDGLEGAQRVPCWKVTRMVLEIERAGIPHGEITKAMRYKEARHAPPLLRRQHYSRRTFDRIALIYRYLASHGMVPADVLEEVGAS